MAVDFTREDLLADISDKELTALTTRLVNNGDPAPLDTAIARAQAMVSRYTERYQLPVEQEKGYIRDLALYYVEFRLEDIEDKRQKAYDQTMRELREIRDHKFTDLAQKDPVPDDIEPYQGAFGSQPKLEIGQ